MFEYFYKIYYQLDIIVDLVLLTVYSTTSLILLRIFFYGVIYDNINCYQGINSCYYNRYVQLYIPIIQLIYKIIFQYFGIQYSR